MSKAMDEIKKELKTLYPDENLTDDNFTEMAQNLVDFFEMGVRSFDKKSDGLIWQEKNEKMSK